MRNGPVFWSLASVYRACAFWQAMRAQRRERARWEVKRRYEVWCEPGVMHAAVPLVQGGSPPLDGIVHIGAVVERSRIARLLVDDRSGARSICSGFEDMAAFVRDFRSAALRARFRNLRVACPMRLEEMQ